MGWGGGLLRVSITPPKPCQPAPPFRRSQNFIKRDKICQYLKPIFHWKWGSRWLPNANEINTKRMKCTCSMRAHMPGDPTQPTLHLRTGGGGLRFGPPPPPFHEKGKNVACVRAKKPRFSTRPPPFGNPVSAPVDVGGNANFRFGVGGNANSSIFRYQHVGMPNVKLWRWGSKWVASGATI